MTVLGKLFLVSLRPMALDGDRVPLEPFGGRLRPSKDRKASKNRPRGTVARKGNCNTIDSLNSKFGP